MSLCDTCVNTECRTKYAPIACHLYRTVPTTADSIRSMSDEELAEFFTQRDMMIIRKILAMFEAEHLMSENAPEKYRKDMMEALQTPLGEG